MVINNLNFKIMETKLEINSLEALREAIAQQIIVMNFRIKNEDGFVIAGYGGETLYSYVGSGMGYMGACLLPCASNPMIFNDEDGAERLAASLDYKNGRNEIIWLNVWRAKDYYTSIVKYLDKTIKAIDSL